MSSGDRRTFGKRHPVVVDVGCGCRRPKPLSSMTSSLPKSKFASLPSHISPSVTTSTNATTTISSRYRDDSVSSPVLLVPQNPSTARRSHWRSLKEAMMKKNEKKTSSVDGGAATTKKRLLEESVAVVKDSSEPYADFKESILQMILEMEISAWEDLRALLHRFLALNSPRHHHLILRAFSEIWHALFAAAPPANATSAASSSSPSPSSSSSSSFSSSSVASTSATPLRR